MPKQFFRNLEPAAVVERTEGDEKERAAELDPAVLTVVKSRSHIAGMNYYFICLFYSE